MGSRPVAKIFAKHAYADGILICRRSLAAAVTINSD